MKKTKFILPVLVLVVGFLISYSVLAQTDSASIQNSGSSNEKSITFPVPELGNCADKESCQNYCEKPTNMEACIAFAKKNGLMGKDEALRAEKYAQGIKNGNGPGGCADQKSCDAFCGNVDNLDSCLSWADKNGIKDNNFDEARKIQGFIKSGGQMPGGCTSKESCDAYCEDFSNAEECFAFAEKAGLNVGMTEGPGGPGGPNRQNSGPTKVSPPPKQMLELIKSGQTPGGCKSKKECEAYCEGGSHFEECIAFAEKAGFMDPKEAEMIKKTGGKGPGGCQGKQACDEFCNNPTNRDACFKFAEENGLISPEELKIAKEGMTRMRAGLDNAPPEVRDCLKSELGPNVIEDIQSGKLVPGPEIGDKMRSCFEKAGGGFKPSEVLKNAPPEVLSCLKDKNIDAEKIKAGQTEFTPEIGDAFRVCFQSLSLMGQGGPMMGGPDGQNSSPPNFAEFLRSAPAEVSQCLQGALGGDFEKIKSGELQMSQAIGEKIKTCFGQFRPQGPNMMGPGGPSGQGGPMMSGGFPKEAEDCIKSKLGEDSFAKFQKGELNNPTVMEKIKICVGSFGPQGGSGSFSPGQTEPNVPMMPNQPNISGQGISGPNFPAVVSDCLKKQLSEDQVNNLMKGERPSSEIEGIMRKCFSENAGPGMMPPQGQFPPQGQQGQPPAGAPNGFTSPSGGTFGSSGQMPPNGQVPPNEMMPPSGQFSPPPEGGFLGGQPPPAGQEGTPPPMPPQGYQNHSSLLGVILSPFINLLSR